MITKDRLFKLHSWVGVNLSILLFVVCFSGTLAVFSHELDWLFNPAMRAQPSDEQASWNTIAANVQAAFPEGRITYWHRAHEPYLTDLIYVKQGDDLKYVFANPYTGAVQGSADITIARFMRDLHYYLFIPFQIGHFTVLFFGFVLTIALWTGLLYYRDWYKKLFVLKTGKGAKVFYSSLHKLIGAWSIPFLMVISLTALWYFVERADFPRISSYLDEARPTVQAPSGVEQPLSYPAIDYDQYAAIAKQAIPGLSVKGIYPPFTSTQSLYLTGPSEVPLVRYRANRVYVDPYTHQVLKVQQADQINTVTWLNDIADPVHFGYWGGLASKTVWFIFGLGLSILILTGPWLFLKKQKKLRKLKKERRVVYG